MLELSELGVRAPGWSVLDGVACTVEPGQVLAVVGESGGGKSTLLRALVGLLPAGWRAQGTARLGDTELTTLRGSDWDAVRGRRIGFVFQEPQRALNPTRTVLSQVELAHRHLAPSRRRSAAVEALSRAGFPEPARRSRAYPHELSGGQRQRVLVAMALAQAPELLLADEPTSHLDPSLQRQILDLLRRAVDDTQAKLLIVGHELEAMGYIADHLLVLYAGRPVEFGPAQDVLRSPRHPYTAALLAARPQGGAPPSPIPGDVPRLDRPPAGCRFHPRCARVEDRCRSEAPAWRASGADRKTACHVEQDGASR